MLRPVRTAPAAAATDRQADLQSPSPLWRSATSAAFTTFGSLGPGAAHGSGPASASNANMSPGPSAATIVAPAHARPEWGW